MNVKERHPTQKTRGSKCQAPKEGTYTQKMATMSEKDDISSSKNFSIERSRVFPQYLVTEFSYLREEFDLQSIKLILVSDLG